MIRKVLIVLVLAMGVACYSAPAMADSIASGTLTLTNCGDPNSGCPGATYNFNVTSTSAKLTITIANNGSLNSTNDNMTAVNLGFTTSNNIISLGTFSTSANVTGTWTTSTGSLSSGGTCGVNSGAFVCASATPLNGLLLQPGQTYSFTWNYTLSDPNGIFSASDVHIGAEYGPNQGTYKGLIVSETIGIGTAVPEPASLTLLGAGLLALGGLARRRFLSN